MDHGAFVAGCKTVRYLDAHRLSFRPSPLACAKQSAKILAVEILFDPRRTMNWVSELDER
ncbi:hypothetical protein ATC03_04625 [Agromyces aureus]|uniref:Uncharacterized protein n=1 Tax=Agromyces aureus TaxID=453304 RepID=A0A191WD18_9MICO|nr:hypothetical protein ATC03_04625 [Agromyces aureus]